MSFVEDFIVIDGPFLEPTEPSEAWWDAVLLELAKPQLEDKPPV